MIRRRIRLESEKMVSKKSARETVSKEFPETIIIGAYEYEQYYGFEIAPKDWKEGEMLADSEVFVRKDSGEIEYLSPSQFMKIMKHGKQVDL